MRFLKEIKNVSVRFYILCILCCAILPTLGIRAAAPVTPAMKDKEIEVWLERHERISSGRIRMNSGHRRANDSIEIIINNKNREGKCIL